MWAAQFLKFEEPNRWMTSGGLGTMGYGFPAAMGVQVAHPDSLVIDIAGEASLLMVIQELSTMVQYRLPVKTFLLNNEYMGMVRQWQEFFHGGRYAESYMDSLPDFVKLAESFGATGLRARRPEEVDDVIAAMIETPGPVIADILVDKEENVFPMIPAGAAHYEMKLGPEHGRAGGALGRRDGARLGPVTPTAPHHDPHRQSADRRAGPQAAAGHPPLGGPEGTAVENSAERRTLSVLVENEPGVLARVIGLFSGRGYNIESLTVAEVEHDKRLSRINLVTSGSAMVIEQIKAQLDRLVPIHKVSDLGSEGPYIERELALIKVGRHRREAGRIAPDRGYLPRPRGRQRNRLVRVRDDREGHQDRCLHPADDAARADRNIAHGSGRDYARQGIDLTRPRAACNAKLGRAGCGSITIAMPI